MQMQTFKVSYTSLCYWLLFWLRWFCVVVGGDFWWFFLLSQIILFPPHLIIFIRNHNADEKIKKRLILRWKLTFQLELWIMWQGFLSQEGLAVEQAQWRPPSSATVDQSEHARMPQATFSGTVSIRPNLQTKSWLGT